MKKPNQQSQKTTTKQNMNPNQNLMQEASEELMQEKGMQKTKKTKKTE